MAVHNGQTRVHSALKTVYVMSVLLGVWPTEKKDGRVKPTGGHQNRECSLQVSCHATYNSLVFILVVVWCGYCITNKIINLDDLVKDSFDVTQVFTDLLSLATAVSSVVFCTVLKRKQFRKMMQELARIDVMLVNRESNIHKKVSAIISLATAMSLIFLLARHGPEMWLNETTTSTLLELLKVLEHLISTCVILQFSGCATLLRYYMIALNDQLSSSTQIPNCKAVSQDTILHSTSSNSDERAVTTSIGNLREMYLILCKEVKLMSKCYGVPVLLALLYIFTSVVKHLYRAILNTNYSQGAKLIGVESDSLILFLCFMSIHVGSLMMIVASCEKVGQEAAQTPLIVHDLLLSPSLDESTRMQLMLFSQQLLRNRIVFTANEFFCLEYTFIHAFCGAASTFIVILLQFRQVKQ